MLTDEELLHNCLSSFSTSKTYYVGHLFGQRYLYVASEDNIRRVLMIDDSNYEILIENVGEIKGKFCSTLN